MKVYGVHVIYPVGTSLDILGIFIAEIPNNLFCTILDQNSDQLSVLLTHNIIPVNKESSQLINKFTDCQKFHNLVNNEITLNIKLKTSYDIDLSINTFAKYKSMT